jgi:hypothetical protein
MHNVLQFIDSLQKELCTIIKLKINSFNNLFQIQSKALMCRNSLKLFTKKIYVAYFKRLVSPAL